MMYTSIKWCTTIDQSARYFRQILQTFRKPYLTMCSEHVSDESKQWKAKKTINAYKHVKKKNGIRSRRRILLSKIITSFIGRLVILVKQLGENGNMDSVL